MSLIFWALLVGAGALIGERYGVPGFVTSITDRGFEMIEARLGKVSEPIPTAEENGVNQEQIGAADNNNDSGAPDQASASTNDGLRINDAGLKIIKESEGLRLEAYNLGGQWLIGYGHSRTARAGMTITEAEAERLLREDVRASEDAVKSMVNVSMNENQFSAMVSLAYNLGSGGFSRSTVLERINKGDYAGAADSFLNHNRAGGKVNEHLTHRREKERALFLTPA